MGLRRTLVLVLALFSFLPAAPGESRTRQASIEGVKLRLGHQSDLLVDFRVEGIRTRGVLETLDAGLPVLFTYWVRVVRPRELLRDEVVAEVRLVRVLEKDNLKNRFRVVSEGGGGGEDVGTLDAALQTMARVEGVSVLPLEVLGSRGPLVLRIKAQLQKFRLPFYLHHLFAFVSYWDVETPWTDVSLPASPDLVP